MPPADRYCSHCGEKLKATAKPPFDEACERMPLHALAELCGCAKCAAELRDCQNRGRVRLAHRRQCPCQLCSAWIAYRAAQELARSVRT
jgi:hypothetical protein